MVLIVFAVILVLWLLCIIKDMSLHLIPRKGSCLNKKQSPWCFNFILRFFYEFFFEFCICVVVQLSVKDFSSFSLGFQFLLSLAATVVSIALISFIASLLFCKGPSIPGFYLKGTAASSVFEKRKLDPNFDAKKHLQQHNPAPKALWGSRIVQIDLDKLLAKLSCKKKSSRVKDQAEDVDDAYSPDTRRNLLIAEEQDAVSAIDSSNLGSAKTESQGFKMTSDLSQSDQSS